MATSIIPSLLIEDFNVIPNKGEEGLTSIIYTVYIFIQYTYCMYTVCTMYTVCMHYVYRFEFDLSA